MERSPGNSAEGHHGNSDKSSKKRGERTLLRLPLIAQEQQAERKASRPAEQRKPTAIEAALANLAAQKPEDQPKKAEATPQPAEAEGEQSFAPSTEAEHEATESDLPQTETAEQVEPAEKTAERDEPTDHHEAVAEHAVEPAEQPEAAEEDYPKWEYQELTSIDLGGGGETVVHLQGDTPVAERVIPLETETTAETTPSNPIAEAAPVFTAQPEQQHQARPPEQLPLTEMSDASSAESFPVANVAISEPAQRAAVPAAEIIEPQLADIYQQQAVAPGVATRPAYGEQVATKRDVENMAYRAERAGQNRGALTGLLVGAGYEHFKHKRRERRQVKRMQEQSKQLEAARQNYQVGLQEQAKRQTETTAVFESMEQRVNGLEKAKRTPRPETVKTPEQIVAEPAEQLQIPPEHRLETSAWHSIEVDARTGKPVENQSFEYGQEYHHERAPEQARGAQQQMSEATTNAAGPSGVAMQSSPVGDDHSSLPPVYIPSASTQGAPKNSAVRDDSKHSAHDSGDGAKPAPLWPWLVALFAVVICLIAVLR